MMICMYPLVQMLLMLYCQQYRLCTSSHPFKTFLRVLSTPSHHHTHTHALRSDVNTARVT